MGTTMKSSIYKTETWQIVDCMAKSIILHRKQVDSINSNYMTHNHANMVHPKCNIALARALTKQLAY